MFSTCALSNNNFLPIFPLFHIWWFESLSGKQYPPGSFLYPNLQNLKVIFAFDTAIGCNIHTIKTNTCHITIHCYRNTVFRNRLIAETTGFIIRSHISLILYPPITMAIAQGFISLLDDGDLIMLHEGLVKFFTGFYYFGFFCLRTG